MKASRGRRRGLRVGQSVVEFGLLVPVLTLLLLGAVDIGRIALTKVTLANASRTAAAYATNYQVLTTLYAGNETNANLGVRQVAVDEAGTRVPLTTSDVTFTSAVTNTLWDPGARYTVTVQTQFKAINPIMSALWGGGGLNLSHSTTMRHNCTATQDCTFPDYTCPPNLSVSVTSASNSSNIATINWTTSASAFSRVELRPATGTYDNGTYYLIGTNTSFTKSIQNVPAGTIFRIRAKDACGVQAYSSEYSL